MDCLAQRPQGHQQRTRGLRATVRNSAPSWVSGGWEGDRKNPNRVKNHLAGSSGCARDFLVQARASLAPGKSRAAATQGSGCVDGCSGGFHCPQVCELSPPRAVQGSPVVRLPQTAVAVQPRTGCRKLCSISARLFFFFFFCIVLSSLTSLLSALLPSFPSPLLPFPSTLGLCCCYFISGAQFLQKATDL